MANVARSGHFSTKSHLMVLYACPWPGWLGPPGWRGARRRASSPIRLAATLAALVTVERWVLRRIASKARNTALWPCISKRISMGRHSALDALQAATSPAQRDRLLTSGVRHILHLVSRDLVEARLDTNAANPLDLLAVDIERLIVEPRALHEDQLWHLVKLKNDALLEVHTPPLPRSLV